jgi:hypothetical protein
MNHDAIRQSALFNPGLPGRAILMEEIHDNGTHTGC